MFYWISSVGKHRQTVFIYLLAYLLTDLLDAVQSKAGARASYRLLMLTAAASLGRL